MKTSVQVTNLIASFKGAQVDARLESRQGGKNAVVVGENTTVLTIPKGAKQVPNSAFRSAVAVARQALVPGGPQ